MVVREDLGEAKNVWMSNTSSAMGGRGEPFFWDHIQLLLRVQSDIQPVDTQSADLAGRQGYLEIIFV